MYVSTCLEGVEVGPSSTFKPTDTVSAHKLRHTSITIPAKLHVIYIAKYHYQITFPVKFTTIL